MKLIKIGPGFTAEHEAQTGKWFPQIEVNGSMHYMSSESLVDPTARIELNTKLEAMKFAEKAIRGYHSRIFKQVSKTDKQPSRKRMPMMRKTCRAADCTNLDFRYGFCESHCKEFNLK
ncbi:MAG TPA: hypothetical protein VGE40_07750 [Bacilli bacterium]